MVSGMINQMKMHYHAKEVSGEHVGLKEFVLNCVCFGVGLIRER
jgi:hypothetical protein